jgi:peroxiredoxin
MLLTRTILLPVLLSVPLALCLLACGASTTADPSKPSEPSEPGSKPAATEGYEPHLVNALTALAAGSPITTPAPRPYGCSVKYAGGSKPATAKLGEPAPALSLPNLAGETVSLADFAGKTVVLEWFNPDCPFVKYAYTKGPLQSLGAEQSKAGVVWLAINSGAPGKQGHGLERNRAAQAEWGIEHAILLDESGEVGHAYGATSTPHLFVIDGTGTLVYAGGLDNAPLGRVE